MTSQSNPPTRKEVHVSRSWPLFHVEDEPETRRDHAHMAVASALGAAALFAAGVPVAPFVLVFIAGVAAERWSSFDDLYSVEDGGPE